MRRVISVYLPNWATECLQRSGRDPRENPATPLVTASHDGRRRVIAAVDPCARALGLRPGLPLGQAQAMIPDLTVVEADPAGDRVGLDRLAAWCLRVAPLVAADPPDGVWIDATGCAHLHGGEAAMLADLLGRLARAGVTARLALADTPGAAHACARFGQDATTLVPPGGQAAALADLPVAALRLPAECVALLHRFGLDRVAALAALPRAPLARRFGPLPGLRLDQALGWVAEPLTPVTPPAAIAERLAFVEPLLTAESFAAVIAELVPPVCAALERAGQGARRLDLLFERVDGTAQAIRIGTARPQRNAAHLTRLLTERLEGVDPGLGVEAMRLVVALAEPLVPMQADSDGPDRGLQVAELVDRLAGRLGAAQVYRVAPVESDIPERSVRRVPALAPPGGRIWPISLPRPSRLFDPPQPVEATALLPDQPPMQFIWRRVRHRVRRADGPERVFGEWWRDAAEAEAVRDYFAVEDEAGRRFWLFRRGDGVDAATGDRAWFLHGLF